MAPELYVYRDTACSAMTHVFVNAYWLQSD